MTTLDPRAATGRFPGYGGSWLAVDVLGIRLLSARGLPWPPAPTLHAGHAGVLPVPARAGGAR